MEKYRTEIDIYNAGTRLCRLNDHDKRLTFQEVVNLWQHSDKFILYFNDLLASCPFESFFWEVKPVSSNTLGEDFEFVLIDSPALNEVAADFETFSAFFNPTCDVVSFPNLGGDAFLVVPCPGNQEGYPSLAGFVRTAPESQILAFWKEVGRVCRNRIEAELVWLSTSGLGVHWLHARLDRKPKYYNHEPYFIH